MSFSCVCLNCFAVWIFVSGNELSDCSSLAVFASLTPPLTLMNAIRSRGFE
jgi:hypothetical protein